MKIGKSIVVAAAVADAFVVSSSALTQCGQSHCENKSKLVKFSI